MEQITLYTDAFWISPYVFSCFVTLKEKGLGFEAIPIALQSQEQQEPTYQARSVTGRVPSLSHGSFWLAESQAIIEYLDEAFPDTVPALPRNIQQRARARQVLSWIRSDLLALREERPTTTLFYDRATEPLSKAGQLAADKLLRVANFLIPDNATSLFGEWSQADSDLALMLNRLVLNGHDVPAKIRTYVDAQWSRPSVRAFVERERVTYVPY